jgi:5-oxoprolinase (ATP-hydrolysing)
MDAQEKYAMASSGWQFWVDRGGTFTDIVARDPDGRLSTHKLLSENPGRYRDAAVAGIRAILGIAPDRPIPDGVVDAVKMGTTVATNALLERKGERVLLVTNGGLGDALRIGNQARPRLFDLDVRLPTMLYDRVVELAGRIGVDGTEIEVLDEQAARNSFAAARADGIAACAIVLIHAWKYPAQEQRLAALAREAGFAQVSASHAVSPLLRLVPRGDTTVVDAYLSPILRRYVDQVAGELGGTRLYFMQSNGGLAEASAFQGKDAILSGPAGGIVGAAGTAAMAGFDRIIGFDMGGTSTDVALYAGAFERAFETEVAGVRVRAPMMAINTVAAGGGSILHFDGARMRVGPDSAGADPGPACYRRGGALTVTDANVCVGKVQPAHFPAIFGPDGDLPLDGATVAKQFAALADAITAATGTRRSAQQVAEGFLQIAVANMANAIKQVSVQKGHDATRFTLACFGGAGGQHACMVADALGMETVLIHPFAGVLSAYGMGLADQAVLREQAVERPLRPDAMAELAAIADRLAEQAAAALAAQGADPARITTRRAAQLRYAGTEAALAVTLADADAMAAEFTTAHRTRFGFATPERALVAEAITVEAVAPGEPIVEPTLAARPSGTADPVDAVDVFTAGAAHRAPVFDRETLLAGDRIAGPALIREANATTVIEPGWTAELTPRNHLILRRTERLPARVAPGSDRPDPVLLEMFNNLFMNVAEQTGAVLQNTSMSVNIKERLDFSCAIFDATGALVANAPHVPVHLGAMGESVRTVLTHRGDSLKPGDVVALNNPFNGGTHLPDVTVITPVFADDGRTIRFFVGSRGHHADIGGLTPGSTPPDSRTLEDEGVVIDDFLLVDGGTFREAAFRDLLAGARYPARSPDVNVADVKAQVAANEKGVQELTRVVADYGWPTVHAYMGHVMDNAEESVRRVLARIGDGQFDYTMDDGAPLRVAVRVDRANRGAVVDFTGTAPARPNNFNAPPAVTRAVVLYVFRCLVGEDIPLNDGCMKPIELVIPAGTFLSPPPGTAVVAGNTEVSQATCNALLGALGALACSQATMNNVLFGDDRLQYYETICGGCGAGPTFAGASAVQTHMTNTRMTDPEVLELRYPVRLDGFAIRRGSGGAGRFAGGDGAVRQLRFLAPMTAVIVASRRRVAPFGLAGGADGAPGMQWVERADGTRHTMGGTDSAAMEPGDVLVIETPGGGGYGAASDRADGEPR